MVVARNVLPNIRYSLQILKDGRVENLDQNFWISDDTYDDTCIWYQIDRLNIAFEEGTYSVHLLADDNDVIETTVFLDSTGSANTDDDMMDDG